MSQIKKLFGAMLLTLTMAVLAQGMTSCSSSNDKRFNEAIEQLNTMLPMNLGNGFTMEKVVSDGDGIVYDIKCNENEIDMAMIEENKDQLRANSLSQLKREKRTNKNFSTLLDYCKDNGKKIIYRYTGASSGKAVDIVIDSDEI